MSPTEKRLLDTAKEAKDLLAAHDRSLQALAAFQKENAKGDEANIHPAQFAHMTLAQYAMVTLP